MDLLVGGFPDSDSRPSIAEGFLRLRATAAEVGVSATQWVDGSFVTSKLNPGDIDVVSFIHSDVLDKLDAPGRQFVVETLAAGPKAKPRYRTDSYFVPVYDSTHPFFAQYESVRSYWRKWFGRGRPTAGTNGETPDGPHKGMLEIGLGFEHLRPTVPAWEDDAT